MQPSIGNLLRELTRLYTQAQREHVTSGHDTSSTQSHVLMELGRADLLTQQELGRRLSLDKGWVSRAVESLVQAELVAKSRHDNDRRSRWLELTAKGKKRYQALNESLDGHAEQLMQKLDSDQRQQIHQALCLLIAGLQGVVPDADLNQHAAPVVTAPTEAMADEPVEPAKVAMDVAVDVAATPTLITAELDHAPQDEVDATAHEEAVVVHAVAAEQEAPASASVVLEPALAEAATSSPAALSAPEASSSEALPRPPSPLADKVRPPMPVAHTRIVGSKTLPTRPLLSRTTPRTPLSRAAQQVEDKLEQASKAQPGRPSHNPALDAGQRAAAPLINRPPATPAPAPARPATQVSRPAMATNKPSPPAPAATHAPEMGAGDTHRGNGSIFQKLLSQGSLFNKLLQREQPLEAPQEEQQAPVEVEPEDGIQFQPASPTDWNEIRNLLTANRLPVQGALNHLMHFVVATENGHVVGAIGMEVYGDIGLIRSLVVASNMRGKSVAKRLLRSLLERARAKQIGAVYLLSGNADALFMAHGFEKMARADMPTKLYVSSELQGASSTSTTALRQIL